jgi:hypothetical protein
MTITTFRSSVWAFGLLLMGCPKPISSDSQSQGSSLATVDCATLKQNPPTPLTSADFFNLAGQAAACAFNENVIGALNAAPQPQFKLSDCLDSEQSTLNNLAFCGASKPTNAPTGDDFECVAFCVDTDLPCDGSLSDEDLRTYCPAGCGEEICQNYQYTVNNLSGLGGMTVTFLSNGPINASPDSGWTWTSHFGATFSQQLIANLDLTINNQSGKPGHVQCFGIRAVFRRRCLLRERVSRHREQQS